MGEENKKPEDKKVEEEKKGAEGEAKKAVESAPKKDDRKEEKKDEKAAEESKEAAKDAPPPPPPEEFVYKVFMHCEGCARKVKRSLRGFEGVEEVITDCKTHIVTVKGKTADPLKVLDRIQRKSHRKVELLTPLPPKPPVEEKKVVEEKPKAEEKKEEPPVIIVVLKVHMHCEACSEEIRKRIHKMKGVNSVEPDLKSSQVTVKGVFDPPKLVEYVYKRTGKHAIIVKQEVDKKEEEKGGGEKEAKGAEKAGGKKEKEGDEGENAAGGEVGAVEEVEEMKVVEMKKNEFLYWNPQAGYYAGYYPRYTMDNVYAPQMFSDENPNAPQMFSDENPNACSVM